MSPPVRRGRSTPEWVAFALASAVLLLLGGFVVAEIPEGDTPPAPVAVIRRVSEREGRFHVEVEVENRGQQTAESVQVSGALVVGGDEQEGDQTIDFLSGGETEELEFVFDEDPADGELTVRVTGFLLP